MAGWSFKQGNAASSTAASLGVAYTSNVVAGNLLIAQCNWTTTTFVSIADTLGSSWTEIGVEQSSGVTGRFFYAKAPSSGANTVTLTINASDPIRLGILEYTAPAGWSLDAISAPSLNNATSTTWAVGPVVTTVSGDLILNLFATNGARTYTDAANPAFTPRNNATNSPSAELTNAAPAGSYSDTGTMSSTTTGFQYLAAFKSPQTPASSGSSWMQTHHDYANKRGVE